jgi:oligosaccharyltransferase complex subunit alpha (ribophorin I)
MPPNWRTFPSILLLILSSLAIVSSAEEAQFENSAIVRTAELGGSIVHVTTTYAIKSLANAQGVYTIALPRRARDASSFFDVRIKGQKNALEIRERPFYTNA